jgi:hypothetical protein
MLGHIVGGLASPRASSRRLQQRSTPRRCREQSTGNSKKTSKSGELGRVSTATEIHILGCKGVQFRNLYEYAQLILP